MSLLKRPRSDMDGVFPQPGAWSLLVVMTVKLISLMTVAVLRRSWAGATVRHLARAVRPATAVMAIPSRFPVASAKPLSSTPEVKEIAGVQFQVCRVGARSDNDGTHPVLHTPGFPPLEQIDSLPAPGSPFHLAFPVHDLQQARHFWGTVMGCTEGRCLPDKWIDFCLYGHQIVCHWVGHNYKAAEHFNPVGGDEVPVPHFGIVSIHVL